MEYLLQRFSEEPPSPLRGLLFIVPDDQMMMSLLLVVY